MSTWWADKLAPYLGEQSALTVILATVLVLLATTRLLTGFTGTSRVAANGARTAPMIPYWFPLLGHIPQFATGSDGLLRKLRLSHPHGVFNLNIFGTIHSIIYKPGLFKSLLNQPSSEASSEAAAWHLLKYAFGYSPKENDSLESVLPQLLRQDEKLLADAEGDMVQRTVGLLRHSIADFVTFNNSQVDQSPWEILAEATVEETSTGEAVVEANMLDLVRNFVAITATPSLVGSDIFANFPDFWRYFWVFDEGYLPLAMQWPRWIPSPKVTRARGALYTLKNFTREFEVAMEKQAAGEDPGSTWQDLDDVGAVIQGRMDVYKEHGVTIQGRAANDLALIWDMNAKADTLVFWLLCRIFADRELLARIRAEIAPFTELFEPSGDFGTAVSEPARLKKLDVEGVATSCPLLLAAYTESLRLDVDVWSSRYLRKDVILGDEDDNGSKFLLREGFWAHIAHDLHFTDPAYFDDPLKWRVDRYANPGAITSSEKTVPQVEHFESALGLTSLIRKEVLAFTAAILAVWDLEPAGGRPWKLPAQVRSFGTKRPSNDLRVWVKQRTNS